ncbi:MAG: hypothetical protein AB7S38_29350 [Vulcanimicrobiota bacterium]
MNKHSRWTAVLMLALLLLTIPAGAEELFVRNRPYKGEVRGGGTSAQVRIDELAAALELELEHQNGVYSYQGTTLTTETIGEFAYIRLSDLKPLGVKVVPNPDLGTIDVYVAQADKPAPAGQAQPAAADWGSGAVVVHFGAPW